MKKRRPLVAMQHPNRARYHRPADRNSLYLRYLVLLACAQWVGPLFFGKLSSHAVMSSFRPNAIMAGTQLFSAMIHLYGRCIVHHQSDLMLGGTLIYMTMILLEVGIS